MFPAERPATATFLSQDVETAEASGAGETNGDWLSIGKSFSASKRDGTSHQNHAVELSDSAMQVHVPTTGNSSTKEKKKHREKRRRGGEESTAVSSQHLLKPHKKKEERERKEEKRESKKRHKSWRSSGSSGEDASQRIKHCPERRSERCRSNSRSRSRARSYNDANQIVVQHERVSFSREKKLFEFDCVGDRNNGLFGSSYVHDRPLYKLATKRDLLTGAWKSPVRPKYVSNETLEEKHDAGRYFSLQARKMETNARRSRLYLAYSEKRLARAVHQGNLDYNDQLSVTAAMTERRKQEMSFIPLDPVLHFDEIISIGSGFDDVNGGTSFLTTGQSVEQHLMRRSKMLNAAIAASPHSSSCWLNLVAFQEQMINLHSESKHTIFATKTSIVEKQAAILGRALAANPHSRKLHCVKLNMLLQYPTNGDSSDVDSIQRQIESLLSRDPVNSDLWIKLLQCRHQRFGDFSMQSVRDLYARILTVLRTESARDEKKTAAAALVAPSLSGKTDVMISVTQKEELSVVLLDFHFLMCVFNQKTGYIERAIAQLQALLDFSMMVDVSDSKEPHVEMLRKFAMRWSDDSALRIGSECRNEIGSSIGRLKEDPAETAMAEYQDYVRRKCVTTVDQVNPSPILRSKEHRQHLLWSTAVCQRYLHSKTMSETGSSELEMNGIASNTANLKASDEMETELKQGSALVYSNLHGYRINVDMTDDSKEYERILGELRGTKESRAQQTRVSEKQKNRHAAVAAANARVEDQRANYGPVGKDDHFVRWLAREEMESQLEWAPLSCNNPIHQDRIEQQPDRAILTEEVQPFLFYVPIAHRWRIVAEMLHICGVHWRGEHSWEPRVSACDSMYADDDADHELLVGPIQSVLNPHATCFGKRALFLDPNDRKKLLEDALLGDIDVKQDMLRDPSKVLFVRRVFAQSLDLFHNAHDIFESELRCLWVGFEAKVACMHQSIVSARHLSQGLAQKSASGEADLDVLYAYAKLELTLRNEIRVRRICENTLKSLMNGISNDTLLLRAMHRFVFLYARLEMWSSTSKISAGRRSRALRCLYTLWIVWQPVQLDGSEIATLSTITKKHRKRTGEYLQEILMSDASTATNLIARYREELKFAFRHCIASTLAGAERGMTEVDLHGQLTCWAGYCLHNLALVVYIYDGFEAACREYREALNDVEHRMCPNMSWAWTCFLEFMQQHQVSGLFPVLAPREWRLSVHDAVNKFPYNELYLRLFVDSEMGNTISQVHRTYFLQIEKRWRRHFDSPRLVECLFALLCEFSRVERAVMVKSFAETDSNFTRPSCCLFHHWDMNLTAVKRVRQIFENMVNQIQTKGNALCWRLYMRFEVALGKIDAAKKVLYRGIAACAWSKALYMDGLRVMRAYMTEDECQELLDFMESKELNLRVEFEDATDGS